MTFLLDEVELVVVAGEEECVRDPIVGVVVSINDLLTFACVRSDGSNT